MDCVFQVWLSHSEHSESDWVLIGHNQRPPLFLGARIPVRLYITNPFMGAMFKYLKFDWNRHIYAGFSFESEVIPSGDRSRDRKVVDVSC